MRYFKAALRKVVYGEEGNTPQTWTEIRLISNECATSEMAWMQAVLEAVNLSVKKDMPLEWVQEIDQYEWESL